MPLTEAPPRTLLHSRDIALRGYRRDDGLYDIEAELADRKSYELTNEDRGRIAPGEKLHGMLMRLTVDEDFRIASCEAVTEFGPYAICPAAAGNFARLAGLTIGRGFIKEALARVAGAEGCTHLRELLQQMATVAFQTIGGERMRQQAERGAAAEDNSGFGGRRGLLNSCMAYAADSPVVQRRWPDLFTGAARPAEAATRR